MIIDRICIVQEFKSKTKQNLCFKKIPEINSSASIVECYICGNGLEDGYRITAKTLTNGVALFCDTHYPLQ